MRQTAPPPPPNISGYDEVIRMLWRSGWDTKDIAERIGRSSGTICPESIVANRLAIIRDAERASLRKEAS